MLCLCKERAADEALKAIQYQVGGTERVDDEAYRMLDKLTADVDAENKRNFDMLGKLIASETQVQTDMYKTMGQINSQVQPGGSTVVVVK